MNLCVRPDVAIGSLRNELIFICLGMYFFMGRLCGGWLGDYFHEQILDFHELSSRLTWESEKVSQFFLQTHWILPVFVNKAHSIYSHPNSKNSQEHWMQFFHRLHQLLQGWWTQRSIAFSASLLKAYNPQHLWLSQSHDICKLRLLDPFPLHQIDLGLHSLDSSLQNCCDELLLLALLIQQSIIQSSSLLQYKHPHPQFTTLIIPLLPFPTHFPSAINLQIWSQC